MLLVFLALGTLAGCESRPDALNAGHPTAPKGADSDRGIAATAVEEMTVWETILMSGEPVGYQSFTFRKSEEGPYFDAVGESRLTIKRFGQTVTQTMHLASRETGDGQVVRLESRVESGTSQTQLVARRVGQSLRFEPQSSPTTKPWSIPLPPVCGGFFAVEWSLRRDPIAAGQSRALQAVIPGLNQVAEIQLSAVAWEPTELPAGPQKLLRMEQTLLLPDSDTSNLHSVLWVTDQGEILKTELPALDQVSYRVARDEALAVRRPPRFDLGDFSTIRVATPLAHAQAARRARYRVSMLRGDPSRVFQQTPGQRVQRVDAHTATLDVRALRGDASLPTNASGPQDAPPKARDREPSALIESNDPEVRQLAAQIATRDSAPWSIAISAERLVFEQLTQKDFSTAMASAAEVARQRQGDCTEHAVLTAAICRARGVPARVLIGLVYVAQEQGFAFHMWNEVWTGAGWIPIDSTLGRGGTGAAHLILGRSSLESDQGLSALLPVLNILGQLKIEVLDAE